MNRRHLVVSAVGAGLAVTGLATPTRGLAAANATEDELSYANFGLATEFLLKDFYTKTAAAKILSGSAARDVARGALNAAEHATALGKLLGEAGEAAAVEEDFEFAWPEGTFADRKAATAAGLGVTSPLLGVYIRAASDISIPSYRTLFASMAANLAQQTAALSRMSGARAVGVSFPPPIDIQTASDAIETYLG